MYAQEQRFWKKNGTNPKSHICTQLQFRNSNTSRNHSPQLRHWAGAALAVVPCPLHKHASAVAEQQQAVAVQEDLGNLYRVLPCHRRRQQGGGRVGLSGLQPDLQGSAQRAETTQVLTHQRSALLIAVVQSSYKGHPQPQVCLPTWSPRAAARQPGPSASWSGSAGRGTATGEPAAAGPERPRSTSSASLAQDEWST